ncbi:uroporphyrinogen decarboxylase [Aestuariispira insulae]|uniref:uroporphyrinogen decarboxylase n=1 Tax=Aestuariispira insulae TaxID=1461337 RepID=UPI000E22D4EE|nr:uroporphyrinogen decarboxylase [Aestuariispira insulae]
MTKTVKPFLAALHGETQARPPIWLMRQAGRYLEEYREVRKNVSGFLELCYTPELACEVTLQPIRRFGFDAAIMFSDILVLPDALGQEVTFVEGEGPKLAPIRNGSDLSKLSADWIHQRLEPVYEAITLMKQRLPDQTALIGFAGAPWTVATYMIEGGSSKDFANTKAWAFQNPNSFQDLINLVADATADYLCAQVDQGVEAVQLFDSWAGVLPEDAFARWVIEPTKRIVDRFKQRHPDIPFIGFPRGAGINYPAYVEATGVTAVGLDTTVPTKWAAETLQKKLPVQGNLDPQVLLAGGDMLDQSVGRILENLQDGPFIFNLGHGIIKETPVSHVERLMNLVRGRV